MEPRDPRRVAALEEFRLTAASNVATLGEAQVSAWLSLISKPCSELAEGLEQGLSEVVVIFGEYLRQKHTTNFIACL